jgi:GTP-binding protein YchF
MTLGKAEAANYPFCTIDPNIGVVAVPDKRLDRLTAMYNSVKTTPAVIEFVDIAGLVKGASKGEGLGNKFLSHIREVDAIVHVVRCFVDPNVIHVDGSINPARDIETINLELIFSDMEIVERRLSKTVKAMMGNKALKKEVDILTKIKDSLESGTPVRMLEFDDPDDRAFVDSLDLLTDKPVLYAANVSEDDLADDGESNENVKAVRELAKKEGSEVFVLCAKIEEEISELDNDEKAEFLADLGVKGSGLDRLIKASYKLLGLISFLTSGPDETRAWTIKNGTKAPQAAGKIHTDFERGFIRAEVVAFDDLDRLGSMTVAKEQGLVRSEGKDYVVKDGDVILFRFNV